MRGDTNQQPARPRFLKLPDQRAAHRPLAIGGAVLFVALLLTGVLHSPLLPLVAAWLFLVALRINLRAMGVAIAAAAVLLLAADALTGGLTAADVVALTAVFGAGTVPSWLWVEREAATRGIRHRMDRILLEAEQGQASDAEIDAARHLEQIDRALSGIRAGTRAERVVLWEVDAEPARAWQRAAAGGRAEPLALPLQGTVMGWVWEEGTTLPLSPVPSWAIGSSVVATRARRDDDRGSIVTFEYPTSATTPPAAALDQAAASLVPLLSMLEERAQAAAERRRSETFVSALRRMPAQIEPRAFASALITAAIDIVGGTGGAMAAWADDEGRIICVEGGEGGPAVNATFAPLESEMALAARGAVDIVREQWEWTASGPAVATAGDRWLRRPRSVAALPLATHDGVIGVLAVWSTDRSRLAVEALALLQTLTPYAALQLQHALEYGRVRESSERDALTGLQNRRAFDREMANETARHERYGHPFALLIIDIDHFKAINDKHGHEAGDAVLRAVATVIGSAIRDVDHAARFGGEEFVVLLPETTLDAAADVAERLRASVEALETSWHGGAIPARVSIGVAAVPGCVKDPRGLLRVADAALYEAKRGGRNKVVRATLER